MHAPEVIVRSFLFARRAKGRHRNPERSGRIEDVPDRAVLAARVRALQDDEQGALAFGIESVLKLVNDGGVLSGLRLGLALVRKRAGVGGIALGEAHALARLDPKHGPHIHHRLYSIASRWDACGHR